MVVFQLQGDILYTRGIVNDVGSPLLVLSCNQGEKENSLVNATAHEFISIRLKRTYEAPEPTDGLRILVDRIWPRGVSKARACIDLWPKDITPSNELRRWYHRDPEKWEEFKERYFLELECREELIDLLWREIGEAGRVTFIYSSKDEYRNNAVALRDFLIERMR